MPRSKKVDNNREKYTTTIDKDLLKKAKIKAAEEGFEGANSIIEKALEMYLGNTASWWQKKLDSGWLDIILVDNQKATYMSIPPANRRESDLADEDNKKRFCDDELEFRNYKRIGFVKFSS